MEDPLSLGKEVVRMQEEAGTPLDIGEICLTLLPPALTAPFLMARAKVDSTLRDLAYAPLPTCPACHLAKEARTLVS